MERMTEDPPSYSINEDPPSYQLSEERDTSRSRIDRILLATGGQPSYTAKLSDEAEELAWFLIEVLAVDYDTRKKPSTQAYRRHLRFTKIAIQLRLETMTQDTTTPSARSQLLEELFCLTSIERKLEIGGSPPTAAPSVFTDLQTHLYGPAKDFGIVPEIINTILSRYTKYSSSDGLRYIGCTQGVLHELGVDGLAEKISWDWIHILPPLKRFRTTTEAEVTGWDPVSHYVAILTTARRLLPKDHVGRSLLEDTVTSLSATTWSDIRARLHRIS